MKLLRRPFVRAFALTALVLLIFVFAGFALDALVARQWHDSMRLHPPLRAGVPFPIFHAFSGQGAPGAPRPEWDAPNDRRLPSSPPIEPMEQPSVLTARILGATPPPERAKALAEILKADTLSGARYVLLDASGKVLYPSQGEAPEGWASLEVPSAPYGFTRLSSTPGANERTLVRLEGTPVQFLYVELRPLPPLPPKIPLLMLGSHVLAVLLGAWVALLLLFHSLGRNARMVDRVLEDLRRGNLKARVPVSGSEEVAGTLVRFNRMIDEIERLVEHLREVEGSRMKLLGELAHDLRTPVASMKNLVETLRTKDDKLGKAQREELLALANGEIDYFGRLVEDLLVLARISEPNYRATSQVVHLDELLRETVDTFDEIPGNGKGEPVRIEWNLSRDVPPVQGDPHLLRRMARNAILNARSYARNRVGVSLEPAEGGVRLLVEDDGPGFPPEILPEFGVRRVGRSLDRVSGDSLHSGLGSIIMHNIARAHGGSLRASNRCDVDGRVLGARVEIFLPR